MLSSIDYIYQKFLEVEKISTDTRQQILDTIYFALKGLNFDGNKFINQALEKGCLYAVTDDSSFEKNQNKRIIVVKDVLKTLQLLANHHRKILNTQILGITGSNGKTTTKQLCGCVLSQNHKILFTIGNLNNQIGVPLTLLKLKKQHDIAIIQMGISEFGDMKQLIDICQPNFGIITNIGKAHLDPFQTLQNILKQKGQLYQYVKKVKGKVFVNADNSMLMKATQEIERQQYSITNKSKIKGKILEHNPCLKFQWTNETQTFIVQTNLFGEYNLENLLASIKVGLYFNISTTKINEALEKYSPSIHRSQYKITSKNHLFIDAYNANASSMNTSLDSFQKLNVNPKMLILGQMLKLGQQTKTVHKQIIKRCQKQQFVKVCLVGKLFYNNFQDEKIKNFIDVNDLKDYFKKVNIEGYYIFIKGSHGNHLQNILQVL